MGAAQWTRGVAYAEGVGSAPWEARTQRTLREGVGTEGDAGRRRDIPALAPRGAEKPSPRDSATDRPGLGPHSPPPPSTHWTRNLCASQGQRGAAPTSRRENQRKATERRGKRLGGQCGRPTPRLGRAPQGEEHGSRTTESRPGEASAHSPGERAEKENAPPTPDRPEAPSTGTSQPRRPDLVCCPFHEFGGSAAHSRAPGGRPAGEGGAMLWELAGRVPLRAANPGRQGPSVLPHGAALTPVTRQGLWDESPHDCLRVGTAVTAATEEDGLCHCHLHTVLSCDQAPAIRAHCPGHHRRRGKRLC